MQPRVFISYRRQDSVAYVHALYERLAATLGSDGVFMDVDAIELGKDFLTSIHSAIASCDMLIAVMGPGWPGGDLPGQRRIDRPDDVVRLEIAEALRAGIKVVPLMVGGVEPPRPETLPDDLAGLDRRQGFAIRDERFADDMDLFVQRICTQLAARAPEAPPSTRTTGIGATLPNGAGQLADAVRRHWIQGVLEPSLGGGELLALRFRPRPDLVPNPFSELINPVPDAVADAHATDAAQDLPALFEQSAHRLLLLGEPGAGKTTSLLVLTRDLLARHAADAAEPVPLVLHLGSWRPAAGRLSDWLLAEMNLRYRLPLAVGRALLHDACVLPMLDGLDELPERYLHPCVDALQDWVREEAAPGFVVCCRRADYERLDARLAVAGAAEIAPLDGSGLEALFRAQGYSGAVRDRLAAGTDLDRLGPTPLLAKMLAAASPAAGATDQSLLDDYIAELFRRASPGRQVAAPSAVLHRLGWIAERMQRTGQHELQIELLDAAWLGPWQRLVFRLGFGVLIGLFAGTVLALYWSILTPNIDLRELGCPSGSAPGTCAAMHRLLPLWPAVGTLWGMALVAVDAVLPRRTGLGDGLGRRGLATAGVAALYLGIWWLLWWGFGLLPGVELVLGPIALSGFALSILVAGWRSQRPGLTGVAMTVEAMAWSWSSAVRGLIYGIPVGLGLWAINALLLGDWVPALLSAYLLLVLPITLLLGGLRGRVLPAKVRPNEGIRLSARNALIAMLSGGLAGALAGAGIGLVLADIYQGRLALTPGASVSLNPGFVARYGLANGLALGTIAGLWLGGAEVLKHLLLRLLAAAGTPLPLRLTAFLDRVCAVGLMQRVGGGYQFVHRLLGEHVAARWAPRA